MKNVPDVIYLQPCYGCPEDSEAVCEGCDFNDISKYVDVTWCEERIEENDKVYFSEKAVKDAVIDMLNYANIDNYDEAIAYLVKRLKGGKE